MGLVRIFNKYPLTHNKNINIFLSMLWPIKTILSTFCLSGVRALPLAAGINEGGHYFRYFGPSVLRAPAEQTKVATIFITKI